MSIDFQQVRKQVIELGKNAPRREQQLSVLRERAFKLLDEHAFDFANLHKKVALVKRKNSKLRCALSVADPLNANFRLHPLPDEATVIATDGSQIYLDKHAAVAYYLVNIGAFQMCYGANGPPQIETESDLRYGDDIDANNGYVTEGSVSLMRDLREREKLAELAEGAPQPCVTMTDGPLELWGGVAASGVGEAAGFGKSLEIYLNALLKVYELDSIAAGYVDKPIQDYIIRLLEVGGFPVEEVVENRPLRGVKDTDLYREILAPGERSAVFSIHSKSSQRYENYKEALALHFCYLNVGRPNHPWIARVEFPKWVAEDLEKLNMLHAILVHQCHVMGSRPYPYMLHRAHETAVVTYHEKMQIESMIAMELSKYGLLGEESHKQGLKNLSTNFTRQT